MDRDVSGRGDHIRGASVDAVRGQPRAGPRRPAEDARGGERRRRACVEPLRARADPAGGQQELVVISQRQRTGTLNRSGGGDGEPALVRRRPTERVCRRIGSAVCPRLLRRRGEGQSAARPE